MLQKPRILVCGGEKDFNLQCFISRATQQGYDLVPLLFSDQNYPLIDYDIYHNQLTINREVLTGISAVMIRFNVFEQLEGTNELAAFIAEAWDTAFKGWILAQDNLKILNPNLSIRHNKIYTLALARRLGISIVETHVSNDLVLMNQLGATKAQISKHLNGGRATERLQHYNIEEVGEILEFPFFVQEELVPPELRVFRIGTKLFAFELSSPELDYRNDPKTTITPCDMEPSLQAQVIELTDRLGLNFSALDFKYCPRSHKALLLEANSQPMFAAFDKVSDHALVDAMLDLLSC